MTKALESKIENYLKNQIKELDGLCYKFMSVVNGVPDQVVIIDGTIHLVEVKRPGKKPRANQLVVHRDINERGVPVYVVDSLETIDAFIRDVLKLEPVDLTIKRKQKPKPTSIKDIDAFKI